VERFPKFVESTPKRAILHPGDVLYLPNPWWHAVVGLESEVSCTVTHWFPPKRFSFEFQPTRTAQLSPIRESPGTKFPDKEWDHPPNWRHLLAKVIDSKLHTV
ncbi:MAG: cupin-like domain-containing protein, partial [Bradymonadaceae bacterium]